VLLHQLSKKHSHHPFRKLPGLPVAAVFHPTQKMFFVATKKFVQIYDLQKAEVVKKLESGLREISSISIHPGGKYEINYILIYQLIDLELVHVVFVNLSCKSVVRTNGSATLFVGLPY
jgi:hypothetical protein